MTIMRLIIMILTLVGVAQACEVPRDPEKLGSDIIKHAVGLDIEGAVKNTHPADLIRFKELHREAARLAEKSAAPEYFRSLTWASSSLQIERMSAEKVYEAFMQAELAKIQTEDPQSYTSLRKQAEAAFRVEFIKRTDESPDTIGVEYRVSAVVDGRPHSKNVLFYLRRHEETWLLVIKAELFQEIREKILHLQKATNPGSEAGPRKDGTWEFASKVTSKAGESISIRIITGPWEPSEHKLEKREGDTWKVITPPEPLDYSKPCGYRIDGRESALGANGFGWPERDVKLFVVRWGERIINVTRKRLRDYYGLHLYTVDEIKENNSNGEYWTKSTIDRKSGELVIVSHGGSGAGRYRATWRIKPDGTITDSAEPIRFRNPL
jgi:hypothetical protein